MPRIGIGIGVGNRNGASMGILSNDKSLLFDGVDEHLTTGGTPDYSFIQNIGIFGFSIWQKTADFTDVIANSYMGNNSSSALQKGFTVRLRNGVVEFTITRGIVGTTISAITTPGFIADNDWHNIICSGDATNIFIWKDNVKTTMLGTFGTLSTGASSNQLDLGATTNTDAFNFNGNLAHGSLWDKTLTDADATAIYNLGKPSNLLNHSSVANLISWWQMQTFPSIADEQGGNTATAINMEAGDLVFDAP